MDHYAVVCCIIGSFISIISGYVTGVMSGAMLFIQEDLKISDEQVQLLTGIMNVSAIAGCLTAGHVSDYFGRRRTFSIAACIFFIGSCLMSLAVSFRMLMAGRCVTGVAVGYALSTAPVYAAEISPAKTRGSLSSIPDISINLGILIGYVANYFLGRLPLAYSWRAMLGLSALPSAVFAVGAVFLPESPRWLVMHGRVDEAFDVLQQLRATGDEAQVLWSEAAPPEERCRGVGVWGEMFLHPTPPVRRMLVAGVGVLSVQHLSGINGVQLYSARVFKAVGIASRNEILAANIGMGLVKTLFILTAILLVDRVGRRGLYLCSLAGVIVSLSCLGLSLTVIEHTGPNQDVPWPWAAIASVFAFVASFSIGLGPITGAYSSEVIPLRLRAQGVGVGVAFNRVANAIVALTFISLSDAITMGGAFFLFGFLSVGAAIFFYFFCPETQGRPLEEIEEVFRMGWRERQHIVYTPFSAFQMR
uniref:Uncharacterized protein n=1 Tax=Avena sativa TaxID=4498 RepID=A0ACD5WFM6_AVESA